MEQFTLFEPVNSDVFDILHPALLELINKNFLDPAQLRCDKRKGYYAISFNGSVFITIPILKTKKQIKILQDNSNTYKSYELESFSQATNYLSEATAALQMVIDAFPKGFSCCSRYNECSDNLACCHPDNEMRMQCYYRRLLSKGIVFFGKNRNCNQTV